ncbi:family 78 glycoside hydrolase catalytic domain [Curtobacterium pusillum]|uniref:alpha-L-rhamnosidase n=1 Tax=Curtobacterium pusillum TaxID=69373 RepID=UPI003805B35E
MSVSAGALRTEDRVTPLGIDAAAPSFAWKLQTDERDVLQTRYEVEVARSADFDSDRIWTSGPVESDLPFGARYAGPPLGSGSRYHWRVRLGATVGGAAVESGWSAPTWFETGILDPSLWTATWIGGPPPASKASDPVLYLRGGAVLSADVVRARAYVSALGWYRLFVNGADITGNAQVPRFTPFSEVVEYQAYDVTDALRAGTNVLAIAVGDGRFRGGLGLTGSREVYGKRIGALAEFVIELADGSTVTTVTDGTWSAGPGRITGSDPKNGERADLRIPDDDWLHDAVPPTRFAPAVELPDQEHPLIAEEVERVRDVQRLRATVSRAPSGAQLLDFGQNFAGHVRIRLSGRAGTVVQLTHVELLTPDGEADTESFTSTGKFFQREIVTLSGRDEWYQPWFTIHGFRYVEVTGLDHAVDPDGVEGIVISSDLERVGTFEASDARLEQLHHNVLWSVISNFTDTPTDCPTRERAGWTGDIQAFAPAGTTFVDSQAFLSRYLRNATIEQWDDGAFPIYVPSQYPIRDDLGRRMTHFMSGAVGWADAAVLLPWTVYRYYGDRQLLARQYASMRKRVDGLERRARTKGHRGHYVVDSGFHFGEWLRPGENPLQTMVSHIVRPPAEIATAYFAHTASVLAQAAEVLGHDDDAERYRALAGHVAAAWRDRYLHADGRVGRDRQDDAVRALAFDLVRPEQRPAVVARLVELIRANGDHLGTGFLSTPMLLDVLVRGGRADVALDLLFQTSNPSWLYQVERGATTVWETWEGYKANGRGKESHNHYALGAVAGWLTDGLAGLKPGAPGYREVVFEPVIAPQLDHVRATVDTPFGPASSGWRRSGDHVEIEVTVPPGAVGDVRLPGGRTTVGSGTHTIRLVETPGTATIEETST